jgi:hypothetical protein
MLKFTLKFYTVAPTCFGLLWPSSGSFSLNLAKVTFFVEVVSKITSSWLMQYCGSMCHLWRAFCVLCSVLTLHCFFFNFDLGGGCKPTFPSPSPPPPVAPMYRKYLKKNANYVRIIYLWMRNVKFVGSLSTFGLRNRVIHRGFRQ